MNYYIFIIYAHNIEVYIDFELISFKNFEPLYSGHLLIADSRPWSRACPLMRGSTVIAAK